MMNIRLTMVTMNSSVTKDGASNRDEVATQARVAAKAAGTLRTTYWKRYVLYLDSSVVDIAKLLVPMKALLMLLPSASSLSP